jgi:Protein of unknown function (DUF1761)
MCLDPARRMLLTSSPDREVAMSKEPTQEAILKGGIMLRTKVNYWAVLVAAVTTLVTSALYYVLFGSAYMTMRGIDPNTTQVTPQAWQMVGQATRNLVVAFVLAHLLRWLQVTTWKRALQVGLLVWFGFQAMAVAGSVLHEGYPLGLYLIHVGDALQATLLMALILGAWRRGRRQAVDTSSAAFTTS